METNFFGSMRMARAFAPVLRDNGGGALVNVLSVLSFISMPQGATYSTSKAAAWSLTNTLRIELRRQGTLVLAVHAGFIDTDMAAGVSERKISPRLVAEQIVAAIEADAEEVLADPTSEMALLRREGLYTSHLTAWRKQRDAGALAGLERTRGRKPADPRDAENAALRRRLERAEAELDKARRVIEIQGNVSALLEQMLDTEGATARKRTER